MYDVCLYVLKKIIYGRLILGDLHLKFCLVVCEKHCLNCAVCSFYICKCGSWMCPTKVGQQLPIRQDQLKIWEVHLQFGRKSLVNLPSLIRLICLQADFFFPDQGGRNQCQGIIFTNQIQL